MSRSQWRLGVAGLGTVGAGLINLVGERPEFAPAGGVCLVTGVSARSRSASRAADVSRFTWFDDPVALAASPDNDIFVELIGGAEGPAKAAVETALRLGKPVVTANKALIAEKLGELVALSQETGTPVHCEGAVAAALPILRSLGRRVDRITQVQAILNKLNEALGGLYH